MRFWVPFWYSVAAVFCVSCTFFESTTAVLWTDKSEFALYAEYFNAGQDRYKVETRYFEVPSEKLTEKGDPPDIVTGSWLKSASTRNLFVSLDELLKKEARLRDAFYPPLLALGNIEGKQYLLPVSFNIPALVFSPDQNGELSNPFTVGLEEIKEQGKAYNAETRGTYSRMGFSPAWNDEFLFITATLFNTSFREAAPLAWEEAALERAVTYIRGWIHEANTGIQAEDDFSFKYLYEPPSKLVLSGRIRFTYMDSSRFFTLSPETRDSLDFRWIAGEDTIPLDEGLIFYGISKASRAKKAAEAFTFWFFREETQRLLLEVTKAKRVNETSFGIAGGFSAMRTVTEQIFPQFYPGLLGRIPPESFLSPPNILPQNWVNLKERVILPYLHERIRQSPGEEGRSLAQRLADWSRINRSQ